MIKLYGTALAIVLASGQLASAIGFPHGGYQVHEDHMHNGSDERTGYLLSEIERLRRDAAGKQERLNQSPIDLEKLDGPVLSEAAGISPMQVSMAAMMANAIVPLGSVGSGSGAGNGNGSQAGDETQQTGNVVSPNATPSSEGQSEEGETSEAGAGSETAATEQEQTSGETPSVLNNAPTAGAGTTTVAVVPLPAGGLLLMAALGGLGLMRRKLRG